MLRGEILAWNMAFALLDALFMLKQDTQSSSLADLSKGEMMVRNRGNTV